MVGTYIGWGPVLLVLLFTKPILIIPVWLCSYAYQTVKDNVLAPKIVGDVMGLHPLVVLLALLVCAQAAGLVGVLLALPLASVLKVLIQYLHEQEAKNHGA